MEGENKSNRELTAKQIERIAIVGANLGTKKIKFTGGEPLLRKDLKEIIKVVFPYYEDTSLTTNGALLTKELAKELKAAGLSRINISLDTLKRKQYKRITGHDCLDKVLLGIGSARDASLYPALGHNSSLIFYHNNICSFSNVLFGSICLRRIPKWSNPFFIDHFNTFFDKKIPMNDLYFSHIMGYAWISLNTF
jgi:hypothetical protein